MLEDNLVYIKTQLDGRTRDRKQLKRKYVVNRLSKSLQSYREDMERRIRYLSHKNPKNVLKRL